MYRTDGSIKGHIYFFLDDWFLVEPSLLLFTWLGKIWHFLVNVKTQTLCICGKHLVLQ